MAQYLIESPHTKEECLRSLDEYLAKGTDVLDKFSWGCGVGDHTGYAIVDVESEAEAKNLVPDFLLGKTKIVKVNKFTPEQIKAYHEK